MRVICTIEARMGSTRLPGKMMEPLVDNRPTIECMVRRLRNTTYPDEVVVATSRAEQDDVIAEAAASLGVPCFRGSESDVLGRIVECAREHEADVICETTGDCPLIDPDVVDQAVATYLDNPRAEYASNILTRSWPHGMDVEVVSRDALERVADATADDAHREHVTTYIRERPAEFNAVHLSPPPALRDPGVRVTLDYPADLELIRAIYERLETRGDPFETGVRDLLDVFATEPELLEINAEHAEFRSNSPPGSDAT